MTLKPSNLMNYFAPTPSMLDIARLQARVENLAATTLITHEQLAGIPVQKLELVKSLAHFPFSAAPAIQMPSISGELQHKKYSWVPWAIGGVVVLIVAYACYKQSETKENTSFNQSNSPNTKTSTSEQEAQYSDSASTNLTLSEMMDETEVDA